MQPKFSPEDLSTLLDEADTAARRLARRLHVSRCDIEDFRQDLLADLVARMPAFDPQRGKLGAFAGIVLRRQSARIAEQVMRERRNTGGICLSIDAPILAGETLTLGETLSEADGLSAWNGQPSGAVATLERQMDLERVLNRLGTADTEICAALATRTVEQIAITSRLSRATLFRRVRELRFQFTAHGLRAA
ncbi:MAG: sigma factor [Paracoccaceae bacterium]|nr:sigma factor [Paracoccaceae bacterium]